jgi:CBS domain-containing protein
MKSPVVCSKLDEDVSAAAARMRSRKIGFVPVCDDTGRVVGTVTDRDLSVRVLAERLLSRTPVRLVMTPGPVTCRPNDDLEVAEDLMRRYHKSRIICVDEGFKPVGVISLSDIATYDDASRVGELLRGICEREVRSTPRPAPPRDEPTKTR